jgi:hypothetical protein
LLFHADIVDYILYIENGIKGASVLDCKKHVDTSTARRSTGLTATPLNK